MSKLFNVCCPKGVVDKTPRFMQERQSIIEAIDSVYKLHNTDKLETPVFELKEVYSNKRNKFERILDLDDQGGEILSMRYDMKTSLTRYLAMYKIEKHIRISQFGNVYRKEAVDYDQMRLREFFVSDFDICGPSDTMLSEVHCLRVACDIIKALKIEESYIIKIGHKKLTECCFRLVAGVNETQAVKLINKLAEDNVRSSIVWNTASTVINDNKITKEVVDEFKKIVELHSGNFTEMILSIQSNEALNNIKEVKVVLSELVQLNEYCKSFLSQSDYNKIQLDLSMVGPRNYFTGLTFAVFLKNADLNLLSGGRYDNLIAKINPKSKFKTNCTGFTLGIDQLAAHRLIKEGVFDLFKRPFKQNSEKIVNLESSLKNTQIVKKAPLNSTLSVDDTILKNVKGTIDRNPEQMIIRENVFNTIVKCFKRYKADTIDTPVIERKDVLMGKYGEDSKLIYDLNEVDNEQMSLRYDLTVPFARYLAMHDEVISDNKMFKRYQIGKVYRRDKPSINSGRYREFYQCDYDIAGKSLSSMAPDAECLTIVYEILRDINLGDYKIKVNHRKFLDGLFEVCGVPESMFRTVCSTVDKLDKTPWAKVYEEMLEKGLAVEAANKIGEYVSLSGGLDLIDKLEQDQYLFKNEHVKLALKELRVLFNHCSNIMDKVSFDLSLARGLDYYTGMIFEAVFIGFESKQQDGDNDVTEEEEAQMSVGSVSGGGRYDNLVNMFSGNDTVIPCVGLSIGVERLMAIYEKKNVTEVDIRKKPVVVMTAQKDMVNDRLKLVSMLLEAGLIVVDSMKKYVKPLDIFQECDRQMIPWAVIIGEDELAQDAVTLRNIKTRVDELIPRSELISRIKKEMSIDL